MVNAISARSDQMLAHWKARPLPEKDEQTEEACKGHIGVWNKVILGNINTTDSSAEFNRKLYQFLVRIKSMPSLQLAFLKQGPTSPLRPILCELMQPSEN